MNGHFLVKGNRTEFVHGFADDIHDAAERSAADADGDGCTLIDRFHAADHAIGRFHGNAAHAAFADVLLHFQNDVDRGRHGEALADDAKRLVDGGHGAFDELHVDGGAGDLDYVSDIF